MSLREMFVALVSALDSLALGAIIAVILFLGICVFRGVKALTFELFRALLQKPYA
jgi:hypothetical protein